MVGSATRRYLAEFLGSFALLLIIGGAAVFTLFTFPLAGLGIARVVVVSLAAGLGLTVLVAGFGGHSGGHFNPAVTLSMASSGRMPLRDVGPYVVAQVAGGVLGMAVVWGVVSGSGDAYALAKAAALASQCYEGGGAPCTYSLGAVFLLEFVLTFVFILTIHLVTRPGSTAGSLAPAAIGFMVGVGNLIAIPVDGASLNPIRSFAPAILSVGFPGAQWAINEDWLFWVAPILGGVLASGVERLLRE